MEGETVEGKKYKVFKETELDKTDHEYVEMILGTEKVVGN